MQFVMRKINTRDFSVATRTTSREINRRIALNLIRELVSGKIVAGQSLI